MPKMMAAAKALNADLKEVMALSAKDLYALSLKAKDGEHRQFYLNVLSVKDGMVKQNYNEGDDIPTYLERTRKTEFGLPDGDENREAALTALKANTETEKSK